MSNHGGATDLFLRGHRVAQALHLEVGARGGDGVGKQHAPAGLHQKAPVGCPHDLRVGTRRGIGRALRGTERVMARAGRSSPHRANRSPVWVWGAHLVRGVILHLEGVKTRCATALDALDAVQFKVEAQVAGDFT